MPPLVGLPQATAERLLDRLGLSYRVQTRPSDRPPGTVMATDPEAGDAGVDRASEVTLVVAARRGAADRRDASRPSRGAGAAPRFRADHAVRHGR